MPKAKVNPTLTFLSREQLLALNDVKCEEVRVPQWKTTVRVKGLSGSERNKFERGNVRVEDGRFVMNPDNVDARLCVLGIVDKDGARVFEDKDADDLGKHDGGALDLIAAAIRRLSGIGQGAEAAETKNSEPGPNGEPISA